MFYTVYGLHTVGVIQNQNLQAREPKRCYQKLQSFIELRGSLMFADFLHPSAFLSTCGLHVYGGMTTCREHLQITFTLFWTLPELQAHPPPVLVCLAFIEVLIWWLTQYYRHMFWTEYTEAASPLCFFGCLLIAHIQLAGWATLVLMTYVFLCLFKYCCVDILYVQTSMKSLAIGLYSIHPVEFPSFTVTRLTSVRINNSKNRFRCHLELHDIFWTVCMDVMYR